jgi:hypothetical protein
LGALYRKREDLISAIRCLERAVLIDTRYKLPELSRDLQSLAQLKPLRNSD